MRSSRAEVAALSVGMSDDTGRIKRTLELLLRQTLIATVVAALAVAGCGGGGGGGGGGDASSSTAAGSGGTTTPPSSEPDKPMASADAVRLLNQATFGPTDPLVEEVKTKGARKFVLEQFSLPAAYYTSGGSDAIHKYKGADFCKDNAIGNNCWRDYYSAEPLSWDFFRNAVNDKGQLRQRVAFALAQIMVVSNFEVDGTYGLREYHNMLLDNAFGNFRDLLRKVTLSPLMGQYLNMVDNNKTAPNENYAREMLQLFSIGTCVLNDDGTLKGGKCEATYGNDTVRAYAFAFTGFTYPIGGDSKWSKSSWHNLAYLKGDMVGMQEGHDANPRTLLGGVTLPASRTPQQALETAIDSVFGHPNVGPFIGKQLIQFLVTSNPSPAYVGRVAAAFNSGKAQGVGSGTRGDMKAVIAAILLDDEARGESKSSDPNYGKLREPALYFAGILRALNGKTDGAPLYWWWGNALSQRVFNSPSVFNFYPADYTLPASSTLVAPQFGIENANTTLSRINFANYLIYWDGSKADANIPNATGTKVDLNSLAKIADKADALVEKLNTVVFAGSLNSTEKSAMLDAVNAWDANNCQQKNNCDYLKERAKTAAYLSFASPQYNIQR
jgi:uncharacterized protein (DUF1800 family)